MERKLLSKPCRLRGKRGQKSGKKWENKAGQSNICADVCAVSEAEFTVRYFKMKPFKINRHSNIHLFIRSFIHSHALEWEKLRKKEKNAGKRNE